MGLDPEGPEAESLLRDLAATDARLCFLALGAPRQERLAARARALAPGVGFASIGAGLDFLGGRQRRAPRWMRALALEWLWRALSDPRRMGPRYARCAVILPGLAAQALRQRRR
jgi:exopolysaccharide biosynthesis WecB/TagA/CpsF family protein